VVGVALKGEGGRGVPGEGLEVADGLTALGEERKAAMPKAVQTPYGLLHKSLLGNQTFRL